MKKLALVAVFALSMITFSSNAQERSSTEQMDPTTQTMQMEGEYTEVDKSTLPQPIKDAIMNDMTGMRVSKAWMAKDDTYKVDVVSQDDSSETKTVYADAEGNWIKPKQTPKK